MTNSNRPLVKRQTQRVIQRVNPGFADVIFQACIMAAILFCLFDIV